MRAGSGANGADNPIFDQLSRLIVYPYLVLMHRLRWYGAENIPRHGAAIIAANHQSFYDPVLISLAANRRVLYLAWEKYFQYPLLGFLMRTYGAIALNIDVPKPGAVAGMLRALRAGYLCGIFPEGGRSADGLPDEPQIGVARLALRSGTPVIPATICGAFRAWPRGQALPCPAPIRLLFQKPLLIPPRRRLRLRNDRSFQREVARQIILTIADGFERLGEPDLALAARRKLDSPGKQP